MAESAREGDSADEKPDRDDRSEAFDTASIVDALGGVRGLLESTIPGVVFAVVFAFSNRSVGPALWAAVGTAVVILVVALVQRRSVQQTIGGFVGIAISAGIVLITGRARDFFLLGIYRNAFWLAAHTISGLVRWPLIGLFLGPFTGEGVQWRKDPARFRAYQWCGLVWIVVFGLRLAIQLPLFRGDDVTGLGVAQIVLGIPLFAAACFANYLILRRVPIRLRSSTFAKDDGDGDGGDDTGGDGRPTRDDGPHPHPPPISPG